MRISDWSSDVCSSDLLFRPNDPFIFTSGRASPVYIDCRKIISFPRARAQLMDFACALIQREAGYESIDCIAGGETAGIPFAAWIAERLGLPMLYVRKKPKGFGRDAQIEGYRSEEHTSELQSLMRISYAVFCLNKNNIDKY